MRDVLAGLVRKILDFRGDDRAAMHARHPACLAKLVEVAPDRLDRHSELRSEILDLDTTGLSQQRDNLRTDGSI